MAKKPNIALRVIVPLVALAAGLGVVYAVFINSGRRSAPTPVTQPVAPAPVPPAAPGAQAPTPPAAEATAVAPPAAGAPAGAVSLAGLKARAQPAAEWSPLGSLDRAKGDELQLTFSPAGAGLEALDLAGHFDTLKNDKHTRLQAEHVQSAGNGAQGGAVVPMAALGVYINDQFVALVGSQAEPVWKQVAPGSFEAEVVNDSGATVARVSRKYELTAGSYDFTVRQSIRNESGQALRVRWMQLGAVDLPGESTGYGGDRRRVRFGYLLSPTADPSRRAVVSNEHKQDHAKALGPPDKATGFFAPQMQLWPTVTTQQDGLELSWVGMTNRYFAVAVHPVIDVANAAQPMVLPAFSQVDRVVLNRYVTGGDPPLQPLLALRLQTGVLEVAPGAVQDLSLGVYAGPLLKKEIRADPATRAAGLDGLVRYNFGGPCGFCTFPWLTGLLLALLRVLHDYILFDWALAIMALVLIVRTILHPVTKWSQIRMQRFGKQMQSMAPKMKIIQEKYKGEPLKLREESAKLWREEGVNPAGMLGCIPMFLQTPVWIALYAMLYFAVELRHEPAFFGLFQAIAPGYPSFLGWFLGDLAEPDRFINFGHVLFNAPLLGPIESLNILPLLLGVVFFIQQKYLTPPTAPGTLSPEQEQTQFMMKIMMVIMFPLFMYNAPSGLALYFLTNSTLSILESRYIRSHIEKYDLLNVAKHKAKKKEGGGFFDRVRKAAEERARILEQSKGRQGRK
jgi:YidC/Oxa1 family membrane protein insertase